MKRTIFILILILGIVFGISSQTTGAESRSQAGAAGPMDLVMLLDTSASMSKSYWETSDYLIGPFLKEFLRVGDTFHLISFAGTPKVEISRLIEGVGDVEAVIGRLLLMYPLDPQSDLAGALSFAENYASSLPGDRHRKLILVTDGDVQDTQALVDAASGRLKSQGEDLQYIKVPVTGNGPSSGRPAQTLAIVPAQTAQAGPQTASPGSQTSGGSSSSGQTSADRTSAVQQPPASQPAQTAAQTGQGQSAQAPAGQSGQAQTQPASPPPAPVLPSSQGGSATQPGPASPQGTGLSSGGAGTQSGVGSSSGGTGVQSGTAPSTTQGATSPQAAAGESTQTASGTGAYQPPAQSQPTSPAEQPSAQSSGQTQSVQPSQTQPAQTQSGQSSQAQSSQTGTLQTGASRQVSGGGGFFSGDIPLPLIIGLIILALIILGLIILFALRHLHSSPNRVMAQAVSPPMDNRDRIEAQRQEQIRGAELMGSYAEKQKHQPKPMPKDTVYVEPASQISEGPLMLNLFVEDQNTAIGRRNIHAVKPGYTFSVGGGKSDFLIFLVPIPPHIADVQFDGRNCTFIPRKPEYFPDIGSQQVPNCIGKSIRVISDKRYELHIRVEMYEDPLKALNKMLHSIAVPGEVK